MAAVANVDFRSWESNAGLYNKSLFRPARTQQQATVPSSSPMICLVDDDPSVQKALADLLSSFNYLVLTFSSAAEFLAAEKSDRLGCLIVDLELPGRSGLTLQTQLADGYAQPIVFLTEGGDVSSCVRAMKAGAIDVLQKPFDQESLTSAIKAALAWDRAARGKRSELAKLQQHYALLTPREREVLPLVASGLLNKQTAAELGTSEITICVHRGQIMRKMAARSLAELVRMADKLGVQCFQLPSCI